MILKPQLRKFPFVQVQNNILRRNNEKNFTPKGLQEHTGTHPSMLLRNQHRLLETMSRPQQRYLGKMVNYNSSFKFHLSFFLFSEVKQIEFGYCDSLGDQNHMLECSNHRLERAKTRPSAHPRSSPLTGRYIHIGRGSLSQCHKILSIAGHFVSKEMRNIDQHEHHCRCVTELNYKLWRDVGGI